MATAAALLTSALLCEAQVVDPEPGRLTGDGPYIIYQPTAGTGESAEAQKTGTTNSAGLARTVTVDSGGEIIDTTGAVPQSFKVLSHDGKISFDVALHPLRPQPWNLPKTVKTFVASDPHGRLDCLVSILRAGGVIGPDLKWSFGPNRLVLCGDVMDRGDDVTQIYWLLYKLEQEAVEAGGSVSFIYGNHEPMVLAGDLRYVREKYKALADTLGMTVSFMYGPDTEIGRWLANCNTILKVGDELFVHAGLSQDLLDLDMAVPEVNALCSEGLFMSSKERYAHSDAMKILYKYTGPVWYRGFFFSRKKYGGKMPREALDAILERYGAQRVFVGHTINRNVRTLYSGRVVAVDVDAKVNYDAGRTRAVLIDGDRDYAVYDSGVLKPLN